MHVTACGESGRRQERTCSSNSITLYGSGRSSTSSIHVLFNVYRGKDLNEARQGPRRVTGECATLNLVLTCMQLVTTMYCKRLGIHVLVTYSTAATSFEHVRLHAGAGIFSRPRQISLLGSCHPLSTSKDMQKRKTCKSGTATCVRDLRNSMRERTHIRALAQNIASTDFPSPQS